MVSFTVTYAASTSAVQVESGLEAVVDRRYDIMRHRVAGRESRAAGRHSRAAGDTAVQPEDAAERRKASGVARTCSGTAEDTAVWRMPRGMPCSPEVLRDAKRTRQDIVECHGMAVEVPAARGCCEKAGGRQDHGGRRRRGQVWRQKTHWKAEDASEAEAESKMERRGIRGFPLQ